jgi:putative SOS response-associated peptidase YedK
MCFHYSLNKKQEEILKTIEAEWELPYEPVYHAGGFTFPVMPVMTMDEPGKVQAFSWGLIPHWVKNRDEALKIRAQTLNARAETIFEKPAFRSAAATGRCIVPADGFFEWMDVEKKKYPHYIHLAENALFGFAGISNAWTDRETGELIRTFAIVTTEANPLMARIHNIKKRMPVILQTRDWKRWLDPNLDAGQVSALLTPCDESLLRAVTISKRITDRGETNVPEVLEPHSYPELDSGKQASLFDLLG